MMDIVTNVHSKRKTENMVSFYEGERYSTHPYTTTIPTPLPFSPPSCPPSILSGPCSDPFPFCCSVCLL
jgi:hypothetical protein